MRMDILTPGDWQDSYSSREVSFHHEVNCLQDVLNVIKCVFGNRRPYEKGDFRIFDVKIYDDKEFDIKADWWFDFKTWELEVIPPTIPVDKSDDRFWYREPFGSQRYRIPVYYPDRVYKS